MSKTALANFMQLVNDDADFRARLLKKPHEVMNELRLNVVEQVAVLTQSEESLRSLAGEAVSADGVLGLDMRDITQTYLYGSGDGGTCSDGCTHSQDSCPTDSCPTNCNIAIIQQNFPDPSATVVAVI